MLLQEKCEVESKMTSEGFWYSRLNRFKIMNKLAHGAKIYFQLKKDFSVLNLTSLLDEMLIHVAKHSRELIENSRFNQKPSLQLSLAESAQTSTLPLLIYYISISPQNK